MTYRIRKSIEFAMAHRLQYHDGLCRNVHGHTYKVEVELAVHRVRNDGMLIDFKDIKDALNLHVKNVCDHAMCFSFRDSLMADMFFQNADQEEFACNYVLNEGGGMYAGKGRNELKIYVIEDCPTAEQLARLWYKQLVPDTRMTQLIQVIVHESPTSQASYSPFKLGLPV